jgi:hypothetical protein
MSKPPKSKKCKNALLHFLDFDVLSSFRKPFPLPRDKKTTQKLAKGLCLFLSPLGSKDKQNLSLLFSLFFLIRALTWQIKNAETKNVSRNAPRQSFLKLSKNSTRRSA